MPTHVWRGNRPLRRSASHPDGEQRIEPGDAFEPTDSELAHLGDDIERRETDAKGATSGASDGPVSTPDDDDDADETAAEYVCEECGRGFDTPQGLGAHSRAHN